MRLARVTSYWVGLVLGGLWTKGVYAFGAGKIPKMSWLQGKGFRHGDIDAVLQDWMDTKKQRPGSNTWKFEEDDVERVYFGNWLRDYSQVVDTKALSVMDIDFLMSILVTFGFFSRGFSGGEFEITEARLGVYSPVEHIDNPKGYAEGKDARTYDKRLRPPVDSKELEVDPLTGMKNYIANEAGHWDTSLAYVRRSLKSSIHFGRLYRLLGKVEWKWEAYRQLGSALHTLEDFTAHSNFCELALINLGYEGVFPFVGNMTRVKSPSGKMVHPLVTGTFGSKDFSHSIIGEIADWLSERSITALHEKVEMAEANQKYVKLFGKHRFGTLAAIQSTLHNITEKKNIIDPQDDTLPTRTLGQKLLITRFAGIDELISSLRDRLTGNSEDSGVLKDMLNGILTFPDKLERVVLTGVRVVVDQVQDLREDLATLHVNLSVFVLKSLEPILTPLIKLATEKLQKLAADILVSSDDQWEVFNNPFSSDPTHSLISKDHFRVILNEPAGNLGKIIVLHTANRVLEAWEDRSLNVDNTVSLILQAMFHPAFHNPSSYIQTQMLTYMKGWIDGQEEDPKREILKRLTKESIRAHGNERFEGYNTGDGLHGMVIGSHGEDLSSSSEDVLDGDHEHEDDDAEGTEELDYRFGIDEFMGRPMFSGHLYGPVGALPESSTRPRRRH